MTRRYMVVGTLLLASVSSAQETRHELLRQKREEKRSRVEPYKPNPVEEQMVRFDKAETPTGPGLCFAP